ncbi:MAG: hypothetical protein HQL53_03565 [Magnetococcales bacterium]|nr:hypothetical protein [Magnetococcales bacterium]
MSYDHLTYLSPLGWVHIKGSTPSIVRQVIESCSPSEELHLLSSEKRIKAAQRAYKRQKPLSLAGPNRSNYLSVTVFMFLNF